MAKVLIYLLAAVAFAALAYTAPSNTTPSQTNDPKVKVCIAKILEVRDGLEFAIRAKSEPKAHADASTEAVEMKSSEVKVEPSVQGIKARVEHANALIKRYLQGGTAKVDNQKQRYGVISNAMLELDIAAHDYILLDPTESTPKEKSSGVKHFRHMETCHTAVLDCYEKEHCRL